MILAGADHPHERDAQQALERAVTDGDKLVTDADVLQEILHRYVAVMEQHGIGRILYFDNGFDRVPGVQRVV